MHRPALVFVLLVCASASGCTSEQPAPAEFVPAGPVLTEQDAVATSWRYMLVHADVYFDPPVASRGVNGETVQYVSLTAIDPDTPPEVIRNREDGLDRWEILWHTADPDGRMGIAVDSRTGVAGALVTTSGDI